jgi:hypothetical protein
MKVRGDTIGTFTPTLALPHQRGRGYVWESSLFEGDEPIIKKFHGVVVNNKKYPPPKPSSSRGRVGEGGMKIIFSLM